MRERERERERERVDSSSGFRRHHRLLVGIVISIGILLYAGFNVWVYQYSKSGKAPSPNALWQTVTKAAPSFPGVTGLNTVVSPSVIPADPSERFGAGAGIQSTTPSASPTPTPRPTGPGEYACDPYGVCNRYSEAVRAQFCTTTYADDRCLDQCGDKEKLCTK